jgi:hypothetical protein
MSQTRSLAALLAITLAAVSSVAEVKLQPGH